MSMWLVKLIGSIIIHVCILIFVFLGFKQCFVYPRCLPALAACTADLSYWG